MHREIEWERERSPQWCVIVLTHHEGSYGACFELGAHIVKKTLVLTIAVLGKDWDKIKNFFQSNATHVTGWLQATVQLLQGSFASAKKGEKTAESLQIKLILRKGDQCCWRKRSLLVWSCTIAPCTSHDFFLITLSWVAVLVWDYCRCTYGILSHHTDSGWDDRNPFHKIPSH